MNHRDLFQINVNAQNAAGETAAMIAAANGNELILKMLVAAPGFDPNVRNARGQTVADILTLRRDVIGKPSPEPQNQPSEEDP
jgi:ankyrin repeat protein